MNKVTKQDHSLFSTLIKINPVLLQSLTLPALWFAMKSDLTDLDLWEDDVDIYHKVYICEVAVCPPQSAVLFF